MWARIVVNPDDESLFMVFELTDINPEGRFHPSLIWVECPPDTQQGYIYDGTKFYPPEQSQE